MDGQPHLSARQKKAPLVTRRSPEFEADKTKIACCGARLLHKRLHAVASLPGPNLAQCQDG